MSLIQRLNQMAKLTPDQIAKKLNNRGWIQGAEFTPAMYADWENQQVIVFRRSNLGQYRCDWGIRYLHQSLPNHWFKLVSQYGGEDDQPDLTA